MRPICLDGAVAGWAGSQGLSAAARAEDEIFLVRRTALRTGAGSYLGWGILRSWDPTGLRRIGMGINGNVMQRVVSAHQFTSNMPGKCQDCFYIMLILAANCEGRVKRAYRLCEDITRAQGKSCARAIQPVYVEVCEAPQ